MAETKPGYRIIRIREDFIEQMKEVALRENLNPEFSELFARKMIELSLPEDEYLKQKIAADKPYKGETFEPFPR